MIPPRKLAASTAAPTEQDAWDPGDSRTTAVVAWHALMWLAVSNAIGLLLASLLLFPSMNHWLGEWTYGHWVSLHLNLNLYGWCSLPLVAWLFRVYGADRPPVAKWVRAGVWGWSAALAAGSISWLNGSSSGKLFLDWQGSSRILFVLAQLFLWAVLAAGLRGGWNRQERASPGVRQFKMAGLVFLLLVPFTLYWATGRTVYPPVNPDTGGPTGASLLNSTLGVVLILLLVPLGLRQKPAGQNVWVRLAWLVFAGELLVCLLIGHGNASHRQMSQIAGLGSLVVWIPLLPACYKRFVWPVECQPWRQACLCWWGLLIASAWLMFLPGLLDRLKFTDALVGHSHLAMAGFVSNLNIFILVNLLRSHGCGFQSRTAFFSWQIGLAGYLFCMVVAGWQEGMDPAFTSHPETLRNLLYASRLICGGQMMLATLYWWRQLSNRLEATSQAMQTPQRFLEKLHQPSTATPGA